MNSCRPAPRHSKRFAEHCCPSKRSFRNLGEIVQDYIDQCREGATEEQEYFADAPDLRSAIHRAALATGANGKRLSHQWRIPGALLQEFAPGPDAPARSGPRL